MTQLDLAIRGGTLVDGTGASATSGDLGIRDGKIVAVGQVSGEAAGRLLFDGKLSMSELFALFQGEYKIKTTELTENFGYTDYRRQHPDLHILFITTESGRVHFPVGEETLRLSAGSRITALVTQQPD